MRESVGFVGGYKAWLNDESNRRDLRDYAEAMWNALLDTDLLNRDQSVLYRAYALMQVCLRSRRKQYLFIRDIALRDQYSPEDLMLCLLGKLIQKLLDARAQLEQKKQSLEPDNFNRYLFSVTRIVLGKCLSELGGEILGHKEERQVELAEASSGPAAQSWELLQYRNQLRKEAKLLELLITENWQERELNVLCHDLESGSEAESFRLSAESKDNIYQLHKRIRDKLKQTMAEHGVSEDAGRIFVAKNLKELCQNCTVLPTYKVSVKATNNGVLNEHEE